VNHAVPISPPAGAADDPVERIDGSRAAGVLFLCDHAANALPKPYGTLGLAREQLDRHIAYDMVPRRGSRLLSADPVEPNRCANKERCAADEDGAERHLCTFHKTYRTAFWTAWGMEIIFATAGTKFVLNTKSI
jgi:hypothetical protein